MDFELTAARRQTLAKVDYRKSIAERKTSRRQTAYPEDFGDGLDIIKEISFEGYAFLSPVLI